MKTEIEKLLKEVRAGKEGSFDRFLNLVQNTVYSFGIRVCGEQEDAKDTLQITLLKAFQALPNVEITDAKALKVWLYKVAKNSCLMMRRKQKPEAGRLTLEESIPSTDGHKTALEIPDWSSLPIETLLKNETRTLVQQAILRLPYQYRIVLVMRDLEQLSTNEVSEILGISQDTVKIRLHRARHFLRNALDKYFPGTSRSKNRKGFRTKVEVSRDVKRKLKQSFQRFSAKKNSP